MGTNHADLPVNAPKNERHSYSKEGSMRYSFTAADSPVYAPNSVGGAHADPAAAGDAGNWASDGEMVRAAATLHPQDDDFGQAGTLVREVMDDAARERLVNNIVGHVSQVERPELFERIFAYWSNVDADLGARVAAGVREITPAAREGANA